MTNYERLGCPVEYKIVRNSSTNELVYNNILNKNMIIKAKLCLIEYFYFFITQVAADAVFLLCDTDIYCFPHP